MAGVITLMAAAGPRGLIVTKLETPSQAVKMTRLSCHRFRSNEVRLALSLRAYDLGDRRRRRAGWRCKSEVPVHEPDSEYEVEQHSRWSISAMGINANA
jgi:hypothetical protein